MATPDDALARLLRARSVAVVGASERPGAPAGFVLRNLLRCGFAGPVYPVHPTAGSVFGLPAWPSLSALPALPDAVLVGLAAERVAGVLEAAGVLGIRAAVVLASGFAERGPAGRALQDGLAAVARRHGMAVCGPNCLGLYDVASGLALYASRIAPTRAGGVAILSHSGALGVALANTGRFGISTLVSAGNAAVTDLPDYLRLLAADQRTRLACLVLETIADPAGFALAMGLMHAAGKPVVALRAGRSHKGAAASAAHTGALAGPDAAFQAFFRREGVIAVDTLDEMIETATLFETERRRPQRPGLALLGVSGGGMAHASDLAEQAGLLLPDLAPDTLDTLRALLPAYATPQNPLDVTGIVFATPAIQEAALRTLAADPAIGLVAAVQDVPHGLDAAGAGEYAGILGAVATAGGQGDTPVVLLGNLGSGPHPLLRPLLDAAGIATLHGTAPALRAIAAFIAPPRPEPDGEPVALRPRPAWCRRLAEGTPFTEREARRFLSDHGLPGLHERSADSRDAAVAAAAAIGFPVAMKVESPDLPHKTEVGGVRLNVADAAGAAAAFDAIMSSVAAAAPRARVSGVSVQEMVAGGVEALLGLSRHETFGLCLVAGLGGVLVEVLRDSALALLPLGRDGARRLLGRTRLAPLLAGVRGAPPADAEALAGAVATLSAIGLAYGAWIEAIEINPLAVLPEGRGVRLLDALVIPRPALPVPG